MYKLTGFRLAGPCIPLYLMSFFLMKNSFLKNATSILFQFSICIIEAFHLHLISTHRSLRFTMEVEYDSCLLFLGVFVERKAGSFITSVYHKPTFTGVNSHWNSFVPKS